MFYGWWIVIACFIIGLYVGGSTVYGFTAFFEPLREEFGWSYTQLSLIGGLRGVEMGIFAPIVGLIADRYDTRIIVIAGTFLVGLGLILLSASNSLTMFYGVYILVAIGSAGCTTVVLMTVVGNWFRRNSGKALGFTACGIGASGLVIPMVVWLIDTFQWRAAFVILGLGMWTVGVPLSFVIRSKPEKYGYLPDGEDRLINRDKGPKYVFLENEITIKRALTDKSFWCLNIAETIRMTVLMAIVTHVMPYLSTVGISRTKAGFVTAAIPILSITGRFGFGWLCDLYDKKLVLVSAYLLMIIGVFSFAYAYMGWSIVCFLIFYPLGYGGGISARTAILREYFGRYIFGKVLGIVMGSAAIGGIIGTVFSGWFFDVFGSYDMIWLLYSGLIAAGILFALNMQPRVATITAKETRMV